MKFIFAWGQQYDRQRVEIFRIRDSWLGLACLVTSCGLVFVYACRKLGSWNGIYQGSISRFHIISFPLKSRNR